MDRVIKFRGKSMSSRWIYGLLTKKKLRNSGRISYAIAKDDCSLGNTIPVTEESIGEFTGLKDIDDKEIYEGDIVKCDDGFIDNIGRVDWYHGGWFVFYKAHPVNYLNWFIHKEKVTVIGNIHDNPELLEGGNIDE